MKILKNAVLLLLTLVFASHTSAQTYTWTGGEPNNDTWHAEFNWNPFGYPDGSAVDAVIGVDAGVELLDNSLEPDEFIKLNTLFVGPNASLQIWESLDFNGTATTTITNQGSILLLDQNGPHELWLTRTILNSGDISANWAAGGALDLFVKPEGATLTGGGTVSLLGNGNSGVSAPDGNPWLTVAEQTIQGYGSLGRDTLGIQNGVDGIIDSNGSTLTFDVSDLGAINDGVIRASNGATLKLENSDITNNNVIEALAGSVVTLFDTNIEGGQLRGDGEFLVQTLSSFTDLATSGTVSTNNGVDLMAIGTITNTGEITINYSSGGDPGSLELTEAGLTLEGGGIVRLAGNFGGFITGASDALLTIDNQTIKGYGRIGNDELQIVNSANGLILANHPSGGRLTIDSGSLGVVNDGIIRAADGGEINISDTNLENTNGIIEAQAGSKVLFEGSEITGGQLVGDGELRVFSDSLFEDVELAGDLIGANTVDVEVRGNIVNSGDIFINYSTGGNPGLLEVKSPGATFTGGGTIHLVGNFGGFIDGDIGAEFRLTDQTIIASQHIGRDNLNIIVEPDATITTNGNLTIDPFGTEDWTTQGTLNVQNGHDVFIDNPTINDGHFEVAEDFFISSIICRADSLIHTANSRLSGVGMIQCFGSMNVDGTITPGSSVGNLKLQSGTGTTLGATAETEIELFNNASYDSLSIIGNLNIGGALHVTLRRRFVPDSSDVFTIVMGGNQEGTFANAAGSIVTTTDGLGCFTVTYSPNSVTLSNFVPLAVLGAVTPTRGTYVSGDLSNLAGSDNVDYVLQRNTADTQSRTEFEVNSTSPVAAPTTMTVRLEGAVFARSQITQTIELYNYASDSWEVVDTRSASRFADSVAEVEVTGDLSRFVEAGTLNMSARVRFVSASARQQFSSNTDQFAWCIE